MSVRKTVVAALQEHDQEEAETPSRTRVGGEGVTIEEAIEKVEAKYGIVGVFAVEMWLKLEPKVKP